ncbi:MAG: hypothetical protein ABW321_21505 [Polyangiales bacterium]
MNESLPLLTSNSTVLWLKVLLTVGALVLLFLRYRKRKASGASPAVSSFRAKVLVAVVVLFACAVFHNLGKPRSGEFVHYGEMFHYYLGSKYFKELGYYELYNAVIVADAEQDNSLAGMPFYTDLTNYKNARRETALRDGARARVKALFAEPRWHVFKEDVAFFKQATGMPQSRVIAFLLMDHGYNASPVSTFVLGTITNVVPVTQLPLLASVDLLLVAAMIGLVFSAFGLEMGALFAVYFFVNILNDHGYVSGALLRYDWLLCIVIAVCLIEKGRRVPAAFFLVLSAMLKVFPAVLLYGVGVSVFQKVRAERRVDKTTVQLGLVAGLTALGLFLLPAVAFGSVLKPWQEFSAKTTLHDSGVYVNHLGLRGMVLFEPNHLSLERFVTAYKSRYTDDIVRHWQDVKEYELGQKRPVIVICALLVLACVTVIIWHRRGDLIEAALWPLLLVYAISYPSHYYYVFLCLFVLLFFRRGDSLSALVPLCLLLMLNLLALVTDAFRPSPIVFYTLTNIYLFVCLASVLGFELYTQVLKKQPELPVASTAKPKVSAKQGRANPASRR